MVKERIIFSLLIIYLLNGCLVQPQICIDTRIKASWNNDKGHIKMDGSDHTVLVVTITNTTQKSIFLEPFLMPQEDGESLVIEPIKGKRREIGPKGTLTWKFTICSNYEAPGTYKIEICVNEECSCGNTEEIVVDE